MNVPEAKFLLSVYRPNGADARDPRLEAALRLAREDPQLAAWFAAQSKFDAVITERMNEVEPPPEMSGQLRAGIALERAVAKRDSGWPGVLATFAMLLVLPLVLRIAGVPNPLALTIHSPLLHPMNEAFLLTLTATGFGVAFLHAAIPTHWLPFVMIGRARGWSRRQIMAAVALAGGGHVVATTGLGVGLAWFGFELSERFDHAFHWAAGTILIGLGAWLAFRPPHGHGCDHCEGQSEKQLAAKTDRAALWALFLTLTLSPCELFLPVYLTAAPYGWSGVAWLSGVLAVATLGGMLALTWLTLGAVQRLRWTWLERLDRRIVGGLLCVLGIATAAFSS